MDERIIYTKKGGSVSVVIPSPGYKGKMDDLAKKVINDASDDYEIVNVSEIPADRMFRNAWKRGEQGNKIGVDMDKAKNIFHNHRRIARDIEMKPHDDIIAKNIPGANIDQAEKERVKIRNKYEKIQADIDSCTTPESLKGVVKIIQTIKREG